MMTREATLQLNLHCEFFDAIAEKRKRVEYRKQSPFWRKRIEGKKYGSITFRNGYSSEAPEMIVELKGIRRYGKGAGAYYAISLGRILKIARWRGRRKRAN